MSWTEERVELLRKLWGDGLSASQVAAELGPGITRNAVIGKIHRLGLAERAKTAAAPRPRSAVKGAAARQPAPAQIVAAAGAPRRRPCRSRQCGSRLCAAGHGRRARRP
ncbi:GcrA family cell cycle regulator [Methylocystis sp. IM2]|uniref:GcrA family cell cycle regulator n=1 Tax=Methylocystis sp. IM2 TaxID=3136563 RepID=UPI0030F5D378